MKSYSYSVDTDNIKIDLKTLQKMAFIHSAVEKGWTAKKRGNSYVFQKHHEGKREVFSEDYLEKFLAENLEIDNKG